jgi:hypothetical protein
MTEHIDPSLIGIPAARIDEAEAHLRAQVARPEWDVFAGVHGLGPLAPAEDTYARLEGIRAMSAQAWDLRGRQGGVERQNLDFSQFGWKDMPGLAEIENPDSTISRNVLWLGRSLGMIDATPLLEGVDPKVRAAVGAFGLSSLHRVQKQHGRRLSIVAADGTLSPSQPDESVAHEGLFVTLGTHRPLNEKAGEPAKVRDFAPGAKTEFDLMVGATRWVLGDRQVQEYAYTLPDAGYLTLNDEQARIVVQEVDGGRKVIKHLYAPRPLVTERDRAQTQHTYALLRQVLDQETDSAGRPLLQEGDDIALATNAIYLPFQHNGAVNELQLRRGWRPHMVTFSAEEGGITRQPVQLLPELHSNVRHLDMLAGSIAVARQFAA